MSTSQTYFTPESARPTPQNDRAGLALVDQLLRDPGALLDRIDDGQDLSELARTMVITIVITAGAFGAAIGAYRGGPQILFAAVKLPLAVLLTAAIATPALHGVTSVLTRSSNAAKNLALVLCSLALASLLISAFAPILLLGILRGQSYHSLIVLTVGCCAVGGACGLSIFVRGLWRYSVGQRALIGSIVLVVFCAVGSQMTWTLRPYLVRPRAPEPVLIRSVEGSFFDSVRTSARSMRGIYSRDEAPLPKEVE